MVLNFHCSMFCLCVFICDRDYQQGQRASSSVSACCLSGRGPTGRDTGFETGLEWGAGEEAELWGYLQTGKNIENALSFRSAPPYMLYIWKLEVVSLTFSSRASPRGRRPTSSTLCCVCWSSTHPTWRIWLERGQRSWRWRDRRLTNWWLRCCPSECPASFNWHMWDIIKLWGHALSPLRSMSSNNLWRPEEHQHIGGQRSETASSSADIQRGLEVFCRV